MRWDRSHESPDVIDRRGERGRRGGGLAQGVLALAPLLLRHPMGRVLLLLFLAGSFVFGMLGQRDDSAPQVAEPTDATVSDDPRHFVSFVLDDVQTTWTGLFAKDGGTYEPAKLVLFDGATHTACGYGKAVTGPFYCPDDERIYIDLSFYDELALRFGASGDFAQAYVIAHEIGHHVQHQLGTTASLRGLSRSEREGETGASVRLELQADCFAGIWAHSTESRGLLEPGDVNEALRAASAVGDDRLQQRATGVVTPESFTHGTATQRARWFRTGYQRGDMSACDTFRATEL
ncbi:MAG TPA: neutral zinc metallopeptidase [Labilithrix sp.]|nr:neutral zinc metallopeptidase [Labilithrix sp.]